ncbi:MAG: hypothetical protein R3230_00975 [Nitrosopumilaceae archaeon]|nr:hypothetical protein [Nitrosopumilaceae archaeon]
MALVKTLSNVKRAKRSTRLREEGVSDEEIMEIFEEILQNAVVAQASGSPKAMRRAIDELKQVRKDVRTGQVRTTSKRQKNIIGRFSNLVDQLENEEQSIMKRDGGDGIASSLPSLDTIVSAVMTANPLLGYSAKIVKDLGGSVKQKTKRDRENARNQAKVIEEQKDFILDRIEVLEDEKNLNATQMNQIDVYKDILERIENEMIQLRKIWESDSDPITVENPQTENKLSQLVKAEEQIIEEQRLKREQDEFNKTELRRIDDVERSGLAGALEKDEDSDTGLLGGLAGMLGGGLMAGLMNLFGIFRSLGTAGKALLRVGVRGSIIGSVILAIYDFIDGFFSAGDILNMSEDDLNIGDRLVAAVSNVVAGFGKMLDTILEWFDIDIIDSENLEQRIGQGVKETVDKIFDWMFGLFASAKDAIKSFDVSELLTSIKDQTVQFMENLLQVIPDAISEAFGAVGDFFENIDWWGTDDNESLSDDANRAIRGRMGFSSSAFSGSSASSMTTDAMARNQQQIDPSSGSGVGVISGNNNTTINNTKTEINSAPNTSNLDNSIRDRNYQVGRLNLS